MNVKIYIEQNNVATKADIRGWWPHITEDLEPTDARSKRKVLFSFVSVAKHLTKSHLRKKGLVLFLAHSLRGHGSSRWGRHCSREEWHLETSYPQSGS